MLFDIVNCWHRGTLLDQVKYIGIHVCLLWVFENKEGGMNSSTWSMWKGETFVNESDEVFIEGKGREREIYLFD